jgi:hypothetical protein
VYISSTRWNEIRTLCSLVNASIIGISIDDRTGMRYIPPGKLVIIQYSDGRSIRIDGDSILQILRQKKQST